MPLTPLTVEQMDEINFLLTEVSLELLGNKFYDIHGQNQNGLAALYSGVGPMPTTNNLNCDLIKELDMEYLVPKKLSEYSDNSDFLTPIDVNDDVIDQASPTKTRRLSCSEAIKPNETESNSERNLQQKKSAAVRRRRQTTATKTSTTDVQQSINIEETEEEIEAKSKKDVVQSIRKMVETETTRMLKNSDRCKEEFYMKNSYRIGTENESVDEISIVEEFYADEKMHLSEESTKLMQLIKFMKSDPRNSVQMKKIAANILLVKDLI